MIAKIAHGQAELDLPNHECHFSRTVPMCRWNCWRVKRQQSAPRNDSKPSRRGIALQSVRVSAAGHIRSPQRNIYGNPLTLTTRFAVFCPRGSALPTATPRLANFAADRARRPTADARNRYTGMALRRT
jgi:hypothetical protein